MRNLKNLFSVFSLAVALFIFVPQLAFAGTENNMSGWAWSSNIGWISFNSTNTNGSVDYGVNQNSDGTVTGYAWSSNIGWIKFGGLSSFPTGSGTAAANAALSGSHLIGWARACAGTANGDCTTMTSRTDGWDGWISLTGTNYGVTFSGTNFSGYAWGGPVIGWVSFNPVVSGATPGVEGCTSSTDCGATYTPSQPGFTLGCPTSTTLTQAQTAGQQSFTIPVQANLFDGFTGSITITPSASSLPSPTYVLNPPSPISCSSGSCSTTVSVKLSSTLSSSGSVNISGQSSSPAASGSCSVTVNPYQANNNGGGSSGTQQFQEF